MSENITDAHVNVMLWRDTAELILDIFVGEIKKYLYEHELWALFDQSYMVTEMHTRFLRRDNV